MGGIKLVKSKHCTLLLQASFFYKNAFAFNVPVLQLWLISVNLTVNSHVDTDQPVCIMNDTHEHRICTRASVYHEWYTRLPVTRAQYMHTSIVSFMILPHVVAYRIACWRWARLRARAACICERRAAWTRYCTRVRAAPQRDSRAYQPSPWIRPGQNRSGWQPGNCDAQARPGARGAGQRPCQTWAG